MSGNSIFLVVVGCLIIPAFAGAKEDPVFSCSFEESVVPDLPRPSIAPRIIGSVEFTDGVSGRAVVCDAKDGFINYNIEKIFDPKNGSICFWMRPVDWNDDDKRFHFFISITSVNPETRERLLLYKYFNNSNLIFLLGPPDVTKNDVLNFSPDDWANEHWRYYSISWSPTDLSVYLDGNLVAHQPRTVEFVATDFKIMTLGAGAFDPSRTGGKSAFDELKMYDRTLSADEIMALFKKKSPR